MTAWLFPSSSVISGGKLSLSVAVVALTLSDGFLARWGAGKASVDCCESGFLCNGTGFSLFLSESLAFNRTSLLDSLAAFLAHGHIFEASGDEVQALVDLDRGANQTKADNVEILLVLCGLLIEDLRTPFLHMVSEMDSAVKGDKIAIR